MENKILIDKKENGKVNDWKGKKENSILLSESYMRIQAEQLKNKVVRDTRFITDGKIERVKECADYLEFKLFEDKSMKLHMANFCKDKFCAICLWRRSLKVFSQISKVMNYIEEHTDYRFIFLTLTQRNVYKEDLNLEIDKMMKAFRKLIMRRKFERSIKGFFRALELTRNNMMDNYHPHFHCILVVEKDYFSNPRKYISHSNWIKFWREVMNLDFDPNVDIRVVKKNITNVDGKIIESYGKAVAEMSKYMAKSTDIFQYDENKNLNEEKTDEVLFTLYDALYKRRLLGMGGIIKDIHKKLNLDDAESENADLILTDEDEIRNDLTYLIAHFRWSFGIRNYYLEKMFEENK